MPKRQPHTQSRQTVSPTGAPVQLHGQPALPRHVDTGSDGISDIFHINQLLRRVALVIATIQRNALVAAAD
eukprot:6566464-Prymnesium_polylepis.1